MGEFGDKFRKEREKKGISLDDVSNVTKISSRMLQAIEEEHFEQLPGGVFNKGFIRAYAKHLGLNDEEAVTSYLACLRQAQIDAHEVWEAAPASKSPVVAANKSVSGKVTQNKAPEKTQASTQVEELPELQLPRAEDIRPPRRTYIDRGENGIPWRIVIVAAVVVILAAVLWIRRSHRTRTETASASSTNPTPVTQSAPASLPAAPVTTLANPAAGAGSAIKTAATAPHPATPNSQSPSVAPSATAVHPPVPAKPTTDPSQANTGANDVTVRSLEPAKPAATLNLTIRASENSWISVVADGQTVSEETLIAPAHTSVHANREIVVKAGNAAGVSFLWNGKEVPAEGTEAEVKTYVFDASGMRVLTPNQNP